MIINYLTKFGETSTGTKYYRVPTSVHTALTVLRGSMSPSDLIHCAGLAAYYYNRMTSYNGQTFSANTTTMTLPTYRAYRKLRELGIIVIDGTYSIGSKSFVSVLNLNNTYDCGELDIDVVIANNDLYSTTAEDFLLDGELSEVAERLLAIQLSPLEQYIKDFNSGFSIDEDRLNYYLFEKYQYTGDLVDMRTNRMCGNKNEECHSAIIGYNNYRAGRTGASYKGIGRAYHSLTSSHREVRQFLQHKNGNLSEADASCLHGVLANLIMSELGYELDEDLLADGKKGCIYETILSKFYKRDHYLPERRNKIKQSFNKWLVMGLNTRARLMKFKTNKIGKIIEEVYPTFFKSLLNYKVSLVAQEDRVNLKRTRATTNIELEESFALLLQQKETELLLPVAMEFGGITLHDAIIVSPDRIDAVLGRLHQVCPYISFRVKPFGVQDKNASNNWGEPLNMSLVEASVVAGEITGAQKKASKQRAIEEKLNTIAQEIEGVELIDGVYTLKNLTFTASASRFIVTCTSKGETRQQRYKSIKGLKDKIQSMIEEKNKMSNNIKMDEIVKGSTADIYATAGLAALDSLTDEELEKYLAARRIKKSLEKANNDN